MQTQVQSLSIRIAISISVGPRIELSRGLFGYTRRRNEAFIAGTKLSGARRRRHGSLGWPLRNARTKFHADQQFGDAFAEQSKRRNEHPEPPKPSGGSEEQSSTGNQQETDAHE